MKQEFEKLILKMLADNEYYGYALFITKFKKDFNNKVPTAAIGVDKNNVILYLSDWFFKLSQNKQYGILKHEVLHFIMKHLTARKDYFQNQEVGNIAMDIAINQLIKKDDLPGDALYPENFNLPKNLTAEQYYDLLLKDKEFMKQLEQNKICSIDDHTKIWETKNPELVEGIIEKTIQEIKKSAGSLPTEISELLEKYNKAKLDWKKLLRKYLSKKSLKKEPTIKRRNRRFSNRLEIKGSKKKLESKLAVIVDISGSMEDQEIIQGLSEINEICKLMNTALDIVQVDYEAREPEKFKKDMKFERKGSGGTYLYKGVEKLRENNIKYDVLVVISDMYLFFDDIEKFENLKVPQIWLGTSGKNPFNSKYIKIFQIGGENGDF